MQPRTITRFEQPERLFHGLQSAAIIDDPSPLQSRVLQATTRLFNLHLPPTGVPHGVESALVHLEGLKVEVGDTGPIIRFCETKNYRVERSSIDQADNQPYPPCETSTISVECELPSEGYYDAVCKVSVNGSVHVAIQEMTEAALV